jgi:hypothetical protein
MVLPDKVPVKTTPAPLKVIALPIRLPLIWRGSSGGEDSVNVPSSPLAVCIKVSEQKSLCDPLHTPVHVPLRSGGPWRAVVVCVGIQVGIGVVRIGAWAGGRLHDGDKDAHGCRDRDQHCERGRWPPPSLSG